MKNRLEMLFVAVLLGAGVGGCATNKISGTKWDVIEVVDPDAQDRTVIEAVDAATIEFRKDGKLVTTYLREDGTAEVMDDDTYVADEDDITITSNGKTQHMMYRFDKGNLRLHSPTFIMYCSPIDDVDDDEQD